MTTMVGAWKVGGYDCQALYFEAEIVRGQLFFDEWNVRREIGRTRQ